MWMEMEKNHFFLAYDWNSRTMRKINLYNDKTINEPFRFTVRCTNHQFNSIQFNSHSTKKKKAHPFGQMNYFHHHHHYYYYINQTKNQSTKQQQNQKLKPNIWCVCVGGIENKTERKKKSNSIKSNQKDFHHRKRDIIFDWRQYKTPPFSLYIQLNVHIYIHYYRLSSSGWLGVFFLLLLFFLHFIIIIIIIWYFVFRLFVYQTKYWWWSQ